MKGTCFKFLSLSLSSANTEVRNLRQENDLLRANLKEYQKELDEADISQVTKK